LIEIQASAEQGRFSEEQFFKMLNLAKDASKEIFSYQNEVLAGIK
jgi:ribonuclease PH